MIDESNRLLDIIKHFKELRKAKGWNKEDAHTIAICAESVQAVALFGDKYTSYAYVIDSMTKYDDAKHFIEDLVKILIPTESNN